MIGRWRARMRLGRALLSRSEWMWRLLSLPPAPDDGRPGLVLIQIDGFSHMELQRALKAREMPFLARLLKREHHELRRTYSGLPSNTPAMQGELFYGVPGAVPAFGFFDHKCNRLCKMFESDSARAVEERLREQGEPLLKGGTSYSNIYTGGAAEARWCFSSLGWGNTTKAPGPALMVLLALLNIWSFARAVAYALLELVIAVWDAVRGVVRGEGFKHEFKFVAARVGLCIILREWVTAAARMDVARGMPVVHINFIGYDEQSHRRGPDSAFAHWVLKGIDDAVKRVWGAAKKSRRREYDIWIYSDHGQVSSQSYRLIHGKSLRERAWELWHDAPAPSVGGRREDVSAETERMRLLGFKRLQKIFPVKSSKSQRLDAAPVAYPVVSELGPVGLIYLGPDASAERRARLGQALVREGGVPLVIEARSEPLRGWTDAGEFMLPRDVDTVLGNHPFREQVIADLERISKHENAGELMAYGWKKGIETPITFALENGSHGGISPEECTSFALMPHHMERELLPAGIPRPADLHRAALIALGRISPEARLPAVRTSGPSEIRVMTYNVHSCVGMDGRHDPRRIARVIAHYHPDVVALQELEMNLPRSTGMNQAQRIAEILQLEYHFHAVRERDDGQFGNAILSRYPMRVLRAGGLPGLPGRRGSETRGALWVELDVDGVRVQVLNTHLGLWPRERLSQLKTLLGDLWLGKRDPGIPLIFCGDLNSGPRSPTYRELARGLRDCQLQLHKHRPRNTWFTSLPMARLDHIFVSEPLQARQIHVPSFHLASVASDHLPLVADIALNGTAEQETKEGTSQPVETRRPGGNHVA